MLTLLATTSECKTVMKIPFLVSNNKTLLYPYCNNNGSVVLILPGGAYNAVSVAQEGVSTAEFLSSRKYCSYIVAYTPLPRIHTTPLTEIESALDYVHIKHPWSKVVVVGLSAGGHLAGTVSMYGRHVVHALALIYPVITMISSPLTHNATRLGLLGPLDVDNATLHDRYSLERHVTACFPPTFLLHCLDDTLVNPGNTKLMEKALVTANVLHEVWYYPHGGHGFAMRKRPMKAKPLGQWPRRLEEWLAKVLY